MRFLELARLDLGRAPGVAAFDLARCGAFRRLCRAQQRASLLSWDAIALRSWANLHRVWADRHGAPVDDLAARAADAWACLLEGKETAQPTSELRAEATRDKQAALVIELTALEAMQALGEGDLTRALSVSRRASRMAQTEKLVCPSFLASLVLARVRRYSGHPHLALRIVSAIAPTAPQRARAWLRWELLLAGGTATEDSGDEGPAPSDAAACSLAMLLRPLRGGPSLDTDRSFDDCATDLERILAPCPLFREEAKHVVALLGAYRPPTPDVAAWQRGEVPNPPAGLQSLLGAGGLSGADDTVMAIVLAGPLHTARRVMRGDPDALAAGTVLDGAQPRVGTGLAALALAGPVGLSISGFFHSTYGFDFVHNIHGGPLDVLVHRMRKAIALHGDIDRDEDRITLRLRSEVAIPDPRCSTAIDTRLVRLLSQMGPLSTDAAASELGLPVRTARALLRQFVADGVCREVREGRFVRYQIEDTTFNEPTPVVMGT